MEQFTDQNMERTLISRKLLQSPDLDPTTHQAERRRAVILLELMAGAPKEWPNLLRAYCHNQFENWARVHRPPEPETEPVPVSRERLEYGRLREFFEPAEIRRLQFWRWRAGRNE